MKNTITSFDLPPGTKERLVETIKKGFEGVSDGFTQLSREIAEFDVRHAERRAKLNDGNRRRTTGRIL